MAKPVEDLQALLKAIPQVKDCYIQKSSGMEYPCIRLVRDDSLKRYADNRVYFFKKRYLATVIDRDPGSAIPDLVEELPYTTFDRFYAAEGLNHFVFKIFF
jgi:hypothetical protein